MGKFTLALVATVAANRYENMNEDELLVNLSSTLSSALDSEARGDGDAAVAKTAAIKNIQKSTIWKEDSVSCNQLNQYSRTPSRPSKRSLMSEEWERNEILHVCPKPHFHNIPI